jgi:hypothetical protein
MTILPLKFPEAAKGEAKKVCHSWHELPSYHWENGAGKLQKKRVAVVALVAMVAVLSDKLREGDHFQRVGRQKTF